MIRNGLVEIPGSVSVKVRMRDEEMLLIATLAQQWRLRLVPSQPVALQPLVTLRPKYRMRMVVEQRKPFVSGH